MLILYFYLCVYVIDYTLVLLSGILHRWLTQSKTGAHYLLHYPGLSGTSAALTAASAPAVSPVSRLRCVNLILYNRS